MKQNPAISPLLLISKLTAVLSANGNTLPSERLNRRSLLITITNRKFARKFSFEKCIVGGRIVSPNHFYYLRGQPGAWNQHVNGV